MELSADQNLNKTRYTHRDYESIKEDLMSVIPSLTQEWTSREESDPGIVLIKLMSMFGDTLSYNVDKIALELYLDTVTQRKNCAMILRLLGYKMHWYRSARVVAQVKLREGSIGDDPVHVVLNPFVTTFSGGSITYTVIPTEDNPYALDINSEKLWTRVYLIEGAMHTVEFNRNQLVNNRFYLAEKDIDESALWLNFGESHTCKLVDNLYLTTDDQNITFEFNIDEFDNPYIELVEYWEDIIGSNAASSNFTLRYVKSKGSKGTVSSNQLREITGVGAESNWGHLGTDALQISHPGNNTDEVAADGFTSPGQDPQTVEEARADAANYITTYDTLVTSYDFERAVKRVIGVTGSKLVDNQVIVNDDLADEKLGGIKNITERANDKFLTQEVSLNNDDPITLMKPYLAILYIAYQNFNSYGSDEGAQNFNQYCQGDGKLGEQRVKYWFSSFDEFLGKTNAQIKEISPELSELKCFPFKPLNNLLQEVTFTIKDCKMLNVTTEYGTTKVYPFKVAGTLHLTEPMSPEETLLAINLADTALSEFYYPDKHEYGEQPRFLDIVETIQNASTSIKYFDANSNITEFSPPCNGLEGFDTTSFAVYTGLSDNFGIDHKFSKFKIRNTKSESSTLENLNKQITEDVKNKLDDESRTYSIPAKSMGSTVVVHTLNQLRALVDDLRADPQLTYVSY